MIILREEISDYLENDLSSLEGKASSSTLEKLRKFPVPMEEFSGYTINSVIDYLFLSHQAENSSLRKLAKEVSISPPSLKKIFEVYGLPTLTQAEAMRRNWQDPDFIEKQAEAARRSLSQLRQDTDFREKQAEGARRELYQRWQDPDLREKQAEAMRRELYQRWQDPDLREKQAEAMRRNWQDPDFIEKQAEAARRNWQDPDFIEKNAEAVRKARLNPENIGRYKLPTIYGYRSDIGFNAQSTWEANFGRILLYVGREFYTRENFKLIVQPDFRELFKSNETEISIDFVVQEPTSKKGNRGRVILYEIMAHPLEDPQGYAKLELLIQQYPNLIIRPINENFYNRLKKHFEQKVNSTLYLHGWETSRDNLRTNPGKYQ